MQADKMKVKSSPEKVVGHTEGKVEYQERSDAYTHIIRGEGYKMIACTPQGSSGTEEADARRLVACWNACEKFSTEDIERANEAYPQGRDRIELILDLTETRKQVVVLEAERDELVKALRESLITSSAYFNASHPKMDHPVLRDAAAILARYPENEE